MPSLDVCVRRTHTLVTSLALLPFPLPRSETRSCLRAHQLATAWGFLVFLTDNAVPGTSSKAITVEGLTITPNDEFLLSSSTGVGGLGRTILWDFANSIPIAQLGEDLDDV